MSKLGDILRRASKLWSYIEEEGFGRSAQRQPETIPDDGEIIYSKNNVCVHQTTVDGTCLHYPGYLSLRVLHLFDEDDEDETGDHLITEGDTGQSRIIGKNCGSDRTTVILTWIPNSILRKNPKTVDDITPSTTPKKRKLSKSLSNDSSKSTWSIRTSRRQSLSSMAEMNGEDLNGEDLNPDEISEALKSMMILDTDLSTSSIAKNGDSSNKSMPKTVADLDSSLVVTNGQPETHSSRNGNNNNSKSYLDVNSKDDNISIFSYSDVFVDVPLVTKSSLVVNDRLSPICVTTPTVTPTHELYGRHLSYENACVKGIFCVDLKEMKSLRLFFSSSDRRRSSSGSLSEILDTQPPTSTEVEVETPLKETNGDNGVNALTPTKNTTGHKVKPGTNGQLVIASRESQYKIFHFHYGGLDKLVTVLEEWDFLMRTKSKNQRKHSSLTDGLGGECVLKFWVCRPEVKVEECHPEEGTYPPLDEATWKQNLLNLFGQIEDDFALRKTVFFGGIEPSLQKDVWPFLLRRFDYSSTYEERAESIREKRNEYKEITLKRELLEGEEKENFWRNVQCTVEKDAPRTDRNNPFFAGENNENVEILKRILLNYAVYNPNMGYTQGMSDLLAPLLVKIQDESETFWCFVGLMQHTLFISSPKDFDMDANLSLLRELIRIMNQPFYAHLKGLPDALELLFAHRWILLCFKREFPEREALKLWESCWAHYQTDYFHLFICLAIIAIYGTDVIDHQMRSDEILLHFSTMSGHMDGELVLRKARGLLYQFRLLSKIPCTLEKLCNLCGPGIWDSGHAPAVECVRNQTELDTFHQCTCFKRD